MLIEEIGYNRHNAELKELEDVLDAIYVVARLMGASCEKRIKINKDNPKFTKTVCDIYTTRLDIEIWLYHKEAVLRLGVNGNNETLSSSKDSKMYKTHEEKIKRLQKILEELGEMI